MSWYCSTSTRVRPALLRQVVEDGAADDAAADHHRPCALRHHGPIPSQPWIRSSPNIGSRDGARRRPGGGSGAARRARGRAARRRADEHELQGHDPGRRATSSASPARTRACSRSTARTRSTTRSPRRRPASARRSSRRCRSTTRSCSRFLDGEVMSSGAAPPRRPARRDRGRLPPPPRRPPFLHDFDMFEIQRGYLDVVRERGFRLPDRYADFEPQVRALEDGDARRITEPTVPCNNDLLAENFIEVGGELRLIDYEYSGNNEPCVRARQRVERVESLARAARGARRRVLRPAAAQQGRARPALGPDVEVRLDALGLDPGRDLRPRLRLLGLGDGEVRAGRRGVRRPATSSSCSPTCSARTRRLSPSAGSRKSSDVSMRASSSSVPIRTGPLNHLRAESTHQPPKNRPMPANHSTV